MSKRHNAMRIRPFKYLLKKETELKTRTIMLPCGRSHEKSWLYGIDVEVSQRIAVVHQKQAPFVWLNRAPSCRWQSCFSGTNLNAKLGAVITRKRKSSTMSPQFRLPIVTCSLYRLLPPWQCSFLSCMVQSWESQTHAWYKCVYQKQRTPWKCS